MVNKNRLIETSYHLLILITAVFGLNIGKNLGISSLYLLAGLVPFIFPLIKSNPLSTTLAAISLNVLYGALFVIGEKIFHSAHPWLMGSIVFSLCSLKSYPWKVQTKEALSIILLAHYAFSALHKVMPLISSLSPRDFILNTLDNFTFFYLGNVSTKSSLGEYFLAHAPWVLVGGSLLVILFQLSSLGAIFKPGLRKKFVFLAFVFHGLTGVFLNIFMTLTPIGLLFFIIIYNEEK